MAWSFKRGAQESDPGKIKNWLRTRGAERTRDLRRGISETPRYGMPRPIAAKPVEHLRSWRFCSPKSLAPPEAGWRTQCAGTSNFSSLRGRDFAESDDLVG
jgi:hypothetical protein